MTMQIISGDCREVLATMPSASVQCCVTSPPYFGLRDYGVDGQMGLEASPDEFVAGMVAVFREVRRVLADDGTLWLNIGDTYAGSGRGGYAGVKGTLDGTTEGQNNARVARGSQLAAGLHAPAQLAGGIGRAWVPPPAGLKQKDLIGIPWMLAFALRADGWDLRQEIIWHKPNPMPESVTDRCTKSHESLFLLSKSPRYHFDADAIAEGMAEASVARLAQDVENQVGSDRVPGKTNGKMKAVGGRARGIPPRHAAYADSSDQSGLDDVGRGGRRNKRSVWTIATQPFREAHFATFPPALVEPCILAGCPVGGTVLDPFFGAGTTGMVADRLQRNCIGVELNPAYAEIARNRISGDAGLFADIAA
jgi:DNA modification methylase